MKHNYGRSYTAVDNKGTRLLSVTADDMAAARELIAYELDTPTRDNLVARWEKDGQRVIRYPNDAQNTKELVALFRETRQDMLYDVIGHIESISARQTDEKVREVIRDILLRIKFNVKA